MDRMEEVGVKSPEAPGSQEKWGGGRGRASVRGRVQLWTLSLGCLGKRRRTTQTLGNCPWWADSPWSLSQQGTVPLAPAL